MIRLTGRHYRVAGSRINFPVKEAEVLEKIKFDIDKANGTLDSLMQKDLKDVLTTYSVTSEDYEAIQEGVVAMANEEEWDRIVAYYKVGAGIYDMIPPIKGATKHIAVPLPDILLAITFPKNKSTLEGVNILVLGNNVEQLPLTNLFETYRYKEDDLNELKYLPEPLKSHLKYRNYRKYCKGNFFKFDKNYKTTMEGLNAALAAVRSFLFTHSNKDLYDHSKTSAVVKHSWPAVKVTNLDNVEIEWLKYQFAYYHIGLSISDLYEKTDEVAGKVKNYFAVSGNKEKFEEFMLAYANQ